MIRRTLQRRENSAALPIDFRRIRHRPERRQPKSVEGNEMTTLILRAALPEGGGRNDPDRLYVRREPSRQALHEHRNAMASIERSIEDYVEEYERWDGMA
jgi:hypothetical protein